MEGMDRDLRVAVVQRSDTLFREVRHQADQQTGVFLQAQMHGWSTAKIEVLCCLNAFYQVVLGPLAAGSRATTKCRIVTSTPIHHGTSSVTAQDAQRVLECHQGFSALLAKLGVDMACVEASDAWSLLRILDVSELLDEEDWR